MRRRQTCRTTPFGRVSRVRRTAQHARTMAARKGTFPRANKRRTRGQGADGRLSSAARGSCAPGPEIPERDVSPRRDPKPDKSGCYVAARPSEPPAVRTRVPDNKRPTLFPRLSLFSLARVSSFVRERKVDSSSVSARLDIHFPFSAFRKGVARHLAIVSRTILNATSRHLSSIKRGQ